VVRLVQVDLHQRPGEGLEEVEPEQLQ